MSGKVLILKPTYVKKQRVGDVRQGKLTLSFWRIFEKMKFHFLLLFCYTLGVKVIVEEAI